MGHDVRLWEMVFGAQLGDCREEGEGCFAEGERFNEHREERRWHARVGMARWREDRSERDCTLTARWLAA